MSSPPKHCLFLGTSDFALPSVQALAESGACELIGVVTQPDKLSGRGNQPTTSPVAAWAKERGIAVWQPKTKQELAALIAEIKPDVGVVVAYGRIINAVALAIPPFGFVNLHPSLLPRWRGPSPIAAAIAAGDRETGVTLIQLDAEMDHGPIIAQESVSVPEDATRTTLEAQLAAQGAALLAQTLPAYLAGTVTPVPQGDTRATICPLLSRDDGQLDWSKPASDLERLVRAYDGWPGTWAMLPDGKRLKVLAVALGNATTSTHGTIASDDQGRLTVACGDGRMLVLLRVQPEGKPALDGAAFLRGYRGPMRLLANAENCTILPLKTALP